MSKKPSDETSGLNETTEQALLMLAIQVKELVEVRSLDSRFAAKLVKRLKREAAALAEGANATKLGQKELKKAFDATDKALSDHDAALLVTANAALRETDNATSSKTSAQRSEGG